MLDVAGIEVVNLAVVYKGRTRIRSARIQIGIGEQHRAAILVRHKILCCQVIPKHWTAMRNIEWIVLVIDVIRITNLNQTVGVVEPAKLRLHMEQEPIGVGRDASRRLILSSSPLLIVRACHLVFLIKHRHDLLVYRKGRSTHTSRTPFLKWTYPQITLNGPTRS